MLLVVIMTSLITVKLFSKKTLVIGKKLNFLIADTQNNLPI